MINSSLDPALWRARLQQDGRVQIPHYLQPAAAQALHACLATEVPWSLAIADAGGARAVPADIYSAMPPEQRQSLFAETAASAARGEYRFIYDSYLMLRAYREGRDPGLLLHKVLEFFNSAECIGWMQALTGDDRIRRMNAQATRYLPGQFLRYHTDAESTEGRLYAYVLNLSRDWHADWGGLLQFIDSDGAVQDTFVPRWNSLSLFKVPTGHAVSMVMPWADLPRLAITGWCQS